MKFFANVVSVQSNVTLMKIGQIFSIFDHSISSIIESHLTDSQNTLKRCSKGDFGEDGTHLYLCLYSGTLRLGVNPGGRIMRLAGLRPSARVHQALVA